MNRTNFEILAKHLENLVPPPEFSMRQFTTTGSISRPGESRPAERSPAQLAMGLSLASSTPIRIYSPEIVA